MHLLRHSQDLPHLVGEERQDPTVQRMCSVSVETTNKLTRPTFVAQDLNPLLNPKYAH